MIQAVVGQQMPAPVVAPPEAFTYALVRLGLSEVAAGEFINNGITNLNQLYTLTIEALDMLIKQIHWDNQGQAYPFIPTVCEGNSFLDQSHAFSRTGTTL